MSKKGLRPSQQIDSTPRAHGNTNPWDVDLTADAPPAPSDPSNPRMNTHAPHPDESKEACAHEYSDIWSLIAQNLSAEEMLSLRKTSKAAMSGVNAVWLKTIRPSKIKRWYTPQGKETKGADKKHELDSAVGGVNTGSPPYNQRRPICRHERCLYWPRKRG